MDTADLEAALDAASPAALEGAVRLYRGDLLADFSAQSSLAEFGPDVETVRHGAPTSRLTCALSPGASNALTWASRTA